MSIAESARRETTSRGIGGIGGIGASLARTLIDRATAGAPQDKPHAA